MAAICAVTGRSARGSRRRPYGIRLQRECSGAGQDPGLPWKPACRRPRAARGHVPTESDPAGVDDTLTSRPGVWRRFCLIGGMAGESSKLARHDAIIRSSGAHFPDRRLPCHVRRWPDENEIGGAELDDADFRHHRGSAGVARTAKEAHDLHREQPQHVSGRAGAGRDCDRLGRAVLGGGRPLAVIAAG